MKKTLTTYAIACIFTSMIMSNLLASTQFRINKKALNHAFVRVKHYLWLTFMRGPKMLFTAQINWKCAMIMTMMCLPSLLFCLILTLPEIIFQFPHQHAYFYFGKVLNEDPTRWIVLFLAGICTIMSLAVPATMSEGRNPIRH